jgi:hypothetical protein
MVHLATVMTIAKGLQSVRQKEKEFVESKLQKLDDFTERDMASQRIKIQMKLQEKKPLNSFEKWFITQPEFHAG